jgi:hypothetical protein
MLVAKDRLVAKDGLVAKDDGLEANDELGIRDEEEPLGIEIEVVNDEEGVVFLGENEDVDIVFE